MLIKNDFEVAEPVEKVWQFFDNIPQVAACLPGAELTEDLGDDKYKGKVAVRMGPVRMQFAGTADITERDEAARRVVVHAIIDTAGRAEPWSVHVIESPHPGFDQAARNFVLEAQFRPGRMRARDVRVSIKFPVNFRTGR